MKPTSSSAKNENLQKGMPQNLYTQFKCIICYGIRFCLFIFILHCNLNNNNNTHHDEYIFFLLLLTKYIYKLPLGMVYIHKRPLF